MVWFPLGVSSCLTHHWKLLASGSVYISSEQQMFPAVQTKNPYLVLAVPVWDGCFM